MEYQNDNKQDSAVESTSEEPPISPATIGWGLAAIVLSIFLLVFNSSPLVLGASFLGKLMAVILGSVFGLAGALLGDALRKFARPDAVFTQGGMLGLVWVKVFWAIGPQVIGLIAGVLIGSAIVLS